MAREVPTVTERTRDCSVHRPNLRRDQIASRGLASAARPDADLCVSGFLPSRGSARRRATPPRSCDAMFRKLATTTAGAVLRAGAPARGVRGYGSQVLVHMGGVDQGEIFSDAHKAICGTGGEVKESRSCRLGGRFSQMFLVSNVDQATVEAALKDFGHGLDHLDIVPARQTTKDIKGPYCATSPLVPFVRHARLTVPWKRGIVDEVTEYLNKNGVSVTDLDEYRAGKDVVLEGFAHLPTGLAEFPQVDESYLLQKLEKMGVKVLEFAKVTGQDPPPGATQAATA